MKTQINSILILKTLISSLAVVACTTTSWADKKTEATVAPPSPPPLVQRSTFAEGAIDTSLSYVGISPTRTLFSPFQIVGKAFGVDGAHFSKEKTNMVKAHLKLRISPFQEDRVIVGIRFMEKNDCAEIQTMAIGIETAMGSDTYFLHTYNVHEGQYSVGGMFGMMTIAPGEISINLGENIKFESPSRRRTHVAQTCMWVIDKSSSINFRIKK